MKIPPHTNTNPGSNFQRTRFSTRVELVKIVQPINPSPNWPKGSCFDFAILFLNAYPKKNHVWNDTSEVSVLKTRTNSFNQILTSHRTRHMETHQLKSYVIGWLCQTTDFSFSRFYVYVFQCISFSLGGIIWQVFYKQGVFFIFLTCYKSFYKDQESCLW